jgi:hypothetical protein
MAKLPHTSLLKAQLGHDFKDGMDAIQAKNKLDNWTDYLL